MISVLIITNYFPPETGAASNRIFHLAEGLQKHNYKVSVLTPLPNYPTGQIFENYKGKFKSSSIENNITIHRLWIYASNSKNKLLRLIAMLSYSFSLFWFFAWNKIPKTVIIQSPPLLVAFTSVFFLRSKKRKIILNVSDLWPIAGLELGAFKKNFSYKLLEKIERFNYKHADLVLGQSNEIINHVKSLFPEKDTFLYRNYPDFIVPEIPERAGSKGKLKMVYAGLLGIAQGIYKLCQELDYTHVQFHIYGAGAEREKIQTLISNNSELDIIYHNEISRDKLHEALLSYDLTIIPLLNRIYGSVPSKIFEYARLGLPMIYFGGGEGESIIKDYRLGWVAEAGNYNDLNTVISRVNPSDLKLNNRNRIIKIAIENFDFDKQLDALIEKV
ncbi:glycosyltransferase family 4 protein [Flavivirga abyssicola]|uniref:glycosyltransferase family 4 protein n=1 Tax=Flavivirga abyssicola TaxID=3063533 RepID=UPI0026DEC86B|nr:glycosyltransferase family 4 protein [Flavivirga sp. MEBiC07777]WVK14783.1 glycosyltransferase family 4 protein [Flavivirga sp. MEBiC07777]